MTGIGTPVAMAYWPDTGWVVVAVEVVPATVAIALAMGTGMPVVWPLRMACGESCEVRAIRFRQVPGGVALPEIDDAACTGCGACLASCPTSAIARAERPLAETRSTPAMELS